MFALRYRCFSPSRERRIQSLGVCWIFSSRLAIRFPRLARSRSFQRGPLAPKSRRKMRSSAARESTTMATPYQGNVTPQIQPTQEARPRPTIRTIGLSDLHRCAATWLGRFQGGAKPRHHSLRDLSLARPRPGASGIWLFRLAAAVSDRRWLCPDRSVCSTRPLRIEPPPRTRRGAFGVGRSSTCCAHHRSAPCWASAPCCWRCL